MQTLAEFLKHEENQKVIMDRVVDALRTRNEWGGRGLFAKLGASTGFSPAYIGQVFSFKKPLTDALVWQLAEYLGVTVDWLRGELDFEYEEIIDILSKSGVPKGVLQIFVENVISSYERTGRAIPKNLGKDRENFINLVIKVVDGLGELWKVEHINWDMLSISDIDKLIVKLNKLRLEKMKPVAIAGIALESDSRRNN